MLRQHKIICPTIVLVGLTLAGQLALAQQTAAPRETVLDKVTHVRKDIVDVPAVAPLCDELPGITKRRIDIGDAHLYVEVEGKGLPIVLLHGGPGSTHHYFHPWLSRCAKFSRVIYYDQRGCGQSGYHPGAGYTVAQAVDDLEHLRKSLQIARWVVLGHSFGGFLAQCYAVKYPEHLAGLILVDSVMSESAEGDLQPTRQGMFITAEEKQRIRDIYNTPGLSLEKLLYNKDLNGDWKRQHFTCPTDEELARSARYEWIQDDGYREHMWANYMTYDLRGAFDTCPIPTLIVEGKWDLTWNTDKPDKMLHLLPKAQMLIFARSGHEPFIDEPEKFTQGIQGFLRQLPKVSRADLSLWQKSLHVLKIHDMSVFNADNANWAKDVQQLTGNYSASWLAAPHDAIALFRTGLALYQVKRYTDALATLAAINSNKPADEDLYLLALVWRGQILDLLTRRAEALVCYREALQRYHNGDTSQCEQFSIIFDRHWIETRIKTPFHVGDGNMPR